MSTYGTYGNQYRKQETYYCPICNVWMSNNSQVRALHENGFKHKEKMRERAEAKRESAGVEMKKEKELMAEMRKIEEDARKAMGMETGGFGGVGGGVVGGKNSLVRCRVDANAEKEEWRMRKEKRADDAELEKRGKKRSMNNVDDVERYRKMMRYGDGYGGSGRGGEAGDFEGKAEIQNEDVEAHYTIDGITYLDAEIFSPLVTTDKAVEYYLKLESKNKHSEKEASEEEEGQWINAIISRVTDTNVANTELSIRSFDLSYLSGDDEVEVKGAKAEEIRLVVGGDESWSTLRVAELNLRGGEELKEIEVGQRDGGVDEDTGLGGWETTEIRTVTVERAEREEKEREENVKRNAEEMETKRKRDDEAKRMEERKHANADDSALGSYDVWGTKGYKGVDVSKDMVTMSDFGNSLAKDGEKVGFKKGKGKKKRGNANKRSATEDDE